MALKFLNLTGLTTFFAKLKSIFATTSEVADVEADTDTYVLNIDYDSTLAFDTSKLCKTVIVYDGTVITSKEPFEYSGLVLSNASHVTIDDKLFDYNASTYIAEVDGVQYIMSKNSSYSDACLWGLITADTVVCMLVEYGKRVIVFGDIFGEEGSEYHMKILYDYEL